MDDKHVAVLLGDLRGESWACTHAATSHVRAILGVVIPREWLEEFEAAARRPLPQRFRYAFIHTYKPILDDAPFRAFDSMSEYRAWCEAHLPSFLGYGRSV